MRKLEHQRGEIPLETYKRQTISKILNPPSHSHQALYVSSPMWDELFELMSAIGFFFF
jgi:hypothetical protein